MGEEARLGELTNLVAAVEDRIPFNRYLGLRDFAVGEDTVRLSLSMREELVGNFTLGSLHGGVISAAFDVVGGIAALLGAVGRDLPAATEEGLAHFSKLGTIDLRVDYLRPAVGEHFEASARVIRAGRRVAVTRMELVDGEGTLLAVGTGTYIIS